MATREEKPPAKADDPGDVKIKVKRKRRRLYQPVPESETAVAATTTARTEGKKPKTSRKKPSPAARRPRKTPSPPAAKTLVASEEREPAAGPAAAGRAEAGSRAAGRAARAASALRLLKKYTLGTAAAGLLPLPLVDLVAFSVLQGQMLKSLAKIYEVEFSEQRARIITGALLSSVTSISVARQTGLLVGSLLKPLPGVGLIAGAALMPATSGASTYALGKVFIQHFETGGTLLDFDPEKMRGYYERQVAEAQTRA